MKRAATIGLMLLSALGLICVAGCPAGGDTSDPNTTASNGTIEITMQADYAASAVSGKTWATLQSFATDCSNAGGADAPGLIAGLDCDADGAPVAYATPTNFRVALQRLTVIAADGSRYSPVNHATLAEAEVIDLATPILLTAEVPVGSYTGMEVVFYYYELTLPLYTADNLQRIRVYLSDDDFPAEGSGGHHQGDITLIAANGAELGFVVAGETWTTTGVQATRGTIVGAGGVDGQTGHARGLYGDADLWDATAFNQGATQDSFLLTPTVNLTLTETGAAFTVTFDVADSWFFEDFDADGVFSPCGTTATPLNEGCAESAAWSPVLPMPTLTFGV